MVNLVIKIINAPQGVEKWSAGNYLTSRGWTFADEAKGGWLPPAMITIHLNVVDSQGLLAFGWQYAPEKYLKNFNFLSMPPSGYYIVDYLTEKMTRTEPPVEPPIIILPPVDRTALLAKVEAIIVILAEMRTALNNKKVKEGL